MNSYKVTIWCDSELDAGKFAVRFGDYMEGIFAEPEKITDSYGLAVEQLNVERLEDEKDT